MSSAPISGADGPDPRTLIAAGWQAEELQWENLQAQGARHHQAGQTAAAAERWAEALRLARRVFTAPDPRLAASLTNHATGLGGPAVSEVARALLDEALLIWDACDPWVAALKPERRARSSLYHLRMETRYPGGYRHFSRERSAALRAEGRAASLARRKGEAPEGEPLARWVKERPAGLNDLRKLMAAARLIV
jgi:hypothetical protein